MNEIPTLEEMSKWQWLVDETNTPFIRTEEYGFQGFISLLREDNSFRAKVSTTTKYGKIYVVRTSAGTEESWAKRIALEEFGALYRMVYGNPENKRHEHMREMLRVAIGDEQFEEWERGDLSPILIADRYQALRAELQELKNALQQAKSA